MRIITDMNSQSRMKCLPLQYVMVYHILFSEVDFHIQVNSLSL